MRISHTELETCVNQPRKWLVAKATTVPHGFPMGYNRALLSAIYHFHRGNSASSTRQYLGRLITRYNFKDPSKVHKIETNLERYLNWAQSSGVITADCRIRISLDVGGFLELRGEIGRVDVITTGYRAVLLSDPPPNWRRQLRMPLIESHRSEVRKTHQ